MSCFIEIVNESLFFFFKDMGGGQSNMLSMFVTVSKVISNGFVWYTVRGRTLDQN